jgi:hypothetical protein
LTPKKFNNRPKLTNAHPPNRNSPFFDGYIGFASVRCHNDAHASAYRLVQTFKGKLPIPSDNTERQRNLSRDVGHSSP